MNTTGKTTKIDELVAALSDLRGVETALHLLKALVAIAERPLARADDLSFDDALEEINSMISLARRTVEHTNYNMLGEAPASIITTFLR